MLDGRHIIPGLFDKRVYVEHKANLKSLLTAKKLSALSRQLAVSWE